MITSADPSTGVAPGTPFTGTFSYDPSRVSGGGVIEGDSQIDYGQHNPYGLGIGGTPNAETSTVQVGGNSVFTESGALVISNRSIQYLGEYGYGGPENPINPQTRLSIWGGTSQGLYAALELDNPTTSVPLSMASPALNLSNFPNATMTVNLERAGEPTTTLYQGTVQTLTPVPVPEPTVLTILATAMAGWAIHRRSKLKLGLRSTDLSGASA